MKRINGLYYLLSVHLSGMGFFIAFRLILYFYNYAQTAGIENKSGLLLQALWKGLQFDNFIASYITFIPLLVFGILAVSGRLSERLVRCGNCFFVIAYSLAFAIYVVDIPYFSYFSAHITIDALGWLQFGSETAGMIFGDMRNYPFFALLPASVYLFCRTLQFFRRKYFSFARRPSQNRAGDDMKIYIPLAVLLLAICTLGMRGSLQRYPLRMGFAYFSKHSFYNQLGINPNFPFLKSIGEASEERKNVNDLMPLDTAFSLVRKTLNVPEAAVGVRSVRRAVQPSGEAVGANVVIVLLESMAAACLQAEYQGRNLTPFLNELISRSYCFERFYSAGIHTNNGIVSTLYGFPAMFDRPSMDNSPARYTGLPVVLRNAGYRTLFFLTSNPQYDHMNLFLYENGIDRIYSQYDYPKEKVVNNFGVQDDYLLEYGLNRLNEAARTDKPFLATFMTVSKHVPYIVPERFKDAGADDEERILAFADNSLKEFMDVAAKQDWYRNTFFIFLGDHGRIKGRQQYDMALDYNHIPCIIYSPLLTDAPRRFPQPCGQIDVFPTVMGLLNRPYVNDSFGIDLLKETRPCMFFVSNNQLGCIDSSYFYVRDLNTDSDILYDLHSDRLGNEMEEHSGAGGKLKTYAVSMTVAADYLIKNKKR